MKKVNFDEKPAAKKTIINPTRRRKTAAVRGRRATPKVVMRRKRKGLHWTQRLKQAQPTVSMDSGGNISINVPRPMQLFFRFGANKEA